MTPAPPTPPKLLPDSLTRKRNEFPATTSQRPVAQRSLTSLLPTLPPAGSSHRTSDRRWLHRARLGIVWTRFENPRRCWRDWRGAADRGADVTGQPRQTYGLRCQPSPASTERSRRSSETATQRTAHASMRNRGGSALPCFGNWGSASSQSTDTALRWSFCQTRVAFANPHRVGGTASGGTNALCGTLPMAASSATTYRSNRGSQ